MQVFEEDEVHDVVDVRGEADGGRGGVEMLAESAQGRAVNPVAARLKQRGDLLELPAAAPRAMDDDHDGLLGSRSRLGRGGAGEADEREEKQEGEFHERRINHEGTKDTKKKIRLWPRMTRMDPAGHK